VLGGLVALSICWFLVFNAWWLNSDGSTYLGTGRDALAGRGFRLPDGGALPWWNRPVYPVLIAVAAHLGGGVDASVWMSRVPLMVAAPIIAAGTLRLGRSVPAAVLAGLVAIAQPWTLLAGGSNLVPDGLASVTVVAAVLAASVGVRSATSRARACWFAAALTCLVLASLTKQTGAVGFLPVAIVVWNGLARPPRWMVITALGVEIVAGFAALVVANGSPEVGLLDLPGTFADRMRAEVFPGSAVIVVAAALMFFLVAWSMPRARHPLPLAGLTVTAAAVALGVYASGLGLQMRNAAMLPYGAALLVGALVAEPPTRRRWRRGLRILVGTVLVLALAAGAEARVHGAGDVTVRSWDSEATREVAAYLVAHRADGSTACTFDYCSFFWLASHQNLETTLLPQYSARPTSRSLAGLDFSRRAGFRGPAEARPSCTGRPLVVTKSDEGFGAVFECPLLRFLRSERPRFVVVSGSGTEDTFDAGRLIPYLSSDPAFRLVYATPMSAWPHVAAVYQLVGDPRPVPGARTYYSTAAYDALPGDHGKPGVTVLDGDRYAQAIRSAFSSLTAPSAAEPNSAG
jgi:hypothetical protein